MKQIENSGRGLIIVHPNPLGKPVFDVFGLKEDLDEDWYKIDCRFVKAENRNDYVGSEDLMHFSERNREVIEKVNELIEKGYKVKFVGWDEEVWP